MAENWTHDLKILQFSQHSPNSSEGWAFHDATALVFVLGALHHKPSVLGIIYLYYRKGLTNTPSLYIIWTGCAYKDWFSSLSSAHPSLLNELFSRDLAHPLCQWWLLGSSGEKSQGGCDLWKRLLPNSHRLSTVNRSLLWYEENFSRQRSKHFLGRGNIFLVMWELRYLDKIE